MDCKYWWYLRVIPPTKKVTCNFCCKFFFRWVCSTAKMYTREYIYIFLSSETRRDVGRCVIFPCFMVHSKCVLALLHRRAVHNWQAVAGLMRGMGPAGICCLLCATQRPAIGPTVSFRIDLSLTTRRRKYNIKTDLKWAGCEYVDWIYLAQDGVQRPALVNTVINILIP
jgi:hypothetical protein